MNRFPRLDAMLPGARAGRLLSAMILLGGALTLASASARASTAPSYYVALGDSLTEGYQPTNYSLHQSETLHGFTDRVVSDLAGHQALTLENYGCGSSTTSLMINGDGCASYNQPLHSAILPGQSILRSALNFLARHRGHVALITLTLGGNDLDDGVTPAETTLNIEHICAALRHAVGPNTPIIGLGYDDPGLAQWLAGSTGARRAASSVTYVARFLNPLLVRAYAPSRVVFLDVAQVFDTFLPFSTTTDLAPYGTIPVAVAKLCTYTWMCARGDVHPNYRGYATIARAVVAAYLRLTK